MDLYPAQRPTSLPTLDGSCCVSTRISSHGEALQLWVPADAQGNVFEYYKDAGGARFAKTRTEKPYSGTATVTTANGTRVIDIAGLVATFPTMQMFADDHLLVVAPRCLRHTDGTFESNARIYRPDGTGQTEFSLGDGIQHLQCDLLGRIWVAYFDEGVYGNNGWGGDIVPIGAAGLVCFDRLGQRLWEFNPPKRLDWISDCYVLNVADNAVWACYYTGFPIVRIDSQFQIQAWRSDLSGPSQLAVAGDMVLAYGGDKANECWLLRLSDEIAERVSEVKLRLPDGFDLDAGTVIGRDRFLPVFANQLWFRFEVPA